MWVPSFPVAVLSGLCAGAGALCIFKDLYGGPMYERAVSAEGRTVVVTGASSGIGRQLVQEFAKRGAKVFMACRDMERCEAARREVVLETGNKYVYCRPCDLASTASVREFVARFKSEEPQLHVLVNNAAVMEPPQRVTRDGFETQLGVNHLGHFLLTNLLLDTLQESAPSRVVQVTCGEYVRGRVRRDDLNLSAQYDARAAYRQSKLANVLFARDLGRRMLGTSVAVVAVDPGFTDSELTRHLPMSRSWTRFLVYPVFWPVMKTPRAAAQAPLHAALDPDLARCTGDLYVDMKKVEVSGEAADFELALWLWKVSERWTKLDEHRTALARPHAAPPPHPAPLVTRA